MTRCRTLIQIQMALLAAVLTAGTACARADSASLALKGNDHGTPACAACHGAQGEGRAVSGFPRLAGLNAGYLQTQLAAFAGGQRVSAMMTPIARTMTQTEWQEMARYYAWLPNLAGASKSTSTLAKTAPPDTDSAGAKLALQGRWSHALPACVQCHGSMGVGVGSVFPALAGQSAVYLQNQLQAWQQGTRAAGPLGLMKVIADKLSAEDIQYVAAYFAALPVSLHPKAEP
ncbi:MAG TPA: cytochrome C [Betaproteobacteria bacterium]|nr:cytochrome C [Betaproteobacteria bacterium]